MTLAELVTILRATGYPLAYSHFKIEPPSIPFITYTTPNDDAFHADNINYVTITNADIELYTDKKDVQAEQTLESLFKEHEIPWTAYQSYIESEQLFQKTYEIGVI